MENDTPYEEKEEWDPIEDVDSSAASDSDSDPRIDMKADFDKVFDGHQTTDDVFDKYAEDVFVDESVDYDTLLQAASDSISEKLSLDAPDDEKEYYQQASADIAYEVTDLDGKPMENLDKMSSMLQENGISEEQAMRSGIQPVTDTKNRKLTSVMPEILRIMNRMLWTFLRQMRQTLRKLINSWMTWMRERTLHRMLLKLQLLTVWMCQKMSWRKCWRKMILWMMQISWSG